MITEDELVTCGWIVVVTLVTAWLTGRAVAGLFRRRGTTDYEAVRPYVRFTRFMICLVGVGLAVHALGFDMTKVFAAGGLFALVMGLALKDIAENLVAGVLIRLEHSISRGDVIEVEGNMVKVTRMGTRSVQARTLDDEDMIIPNSDLIDSVVTNFTLRDPLYRLSVEVEVPAGADGEAVRASLEATAAGIDWRAQDRAPVVLFLNRSAEGATYRVSVWIDDPWMTATRSSDLGEAVWAALEDDLAVAP